MVHTVSIPEFWYGRGEDRLNLSVPWFISTVVKTEPLFSDRNALLVLLILLGAALSVDRRVSADVVQYLVLSMHNS